MNDTFDNQEATNVWRQQTTEGLILPVDEIRKRAKNSKARARRQVHVRRGAVAVGLLVWIGMILVGDSPYHVWFNVAGIVAYVVLLTQLQDTAATHASKRLLILDLTSTPAPCLDFYRTELEVRLDSLRRSRGAMIIVGLIGLAPVLLLGKNSVIAIPMGLGLLLVAAVWYYRRTQEIPRIQLEMDELKAFTRNSNS